VQVRQITPRFRLRVERNLVVVRVVVRDANQRTVRNLHKEDFRLFDDGKPVEVTGFSVEAAGPKTAAAEVRSTPAAATGAATSSLSSPAPAAPQRFVALFFDDLHMEAEEIARTRDAAWRYLATAASPQDRVALFTSSGQNQLDFTGDRAKLQEALLSRAPRSRISAPGGDQDISEYQAYLIDQVRDREATEIAFADATQRICCQPGDSLADPAMTGGSPRSGEAPFAGHCELSAHQWALAEAAGIWASAKIQSENSLERISGGVSRLAAMPGQRNLVLVSCGFLTQTREAEMDAIIDQALRQGVVINALDAAGPSARVPHRILAATRPDLDAQKTILDQRALNNARDVLANLTAGTGGVFFYDSGDFDAGFRQVAAVPEVYYVLSFSPQTVDLNGKFHSLKITLNNHEPFAVQARRGYFAPSGGPADQPPGAAELQRVVFSLEEHHELPAQVSAKVEKLNGQNSTLTVSIHVDVASLRYRKEAGRSVDTLIFDTALFDHDGKYVSSKEGTLELHLKDGTLEKFSRSGIYAQTSFKVGPGTYRVREVVRDSESTGMSALNCDAQVPGASP
jgi:VWFA-related protein